MAYVNPLMVALGAQLPGPEPTPKPMGKGQLIAGILADALAGAMGRPGQFAQHVGQQQQQQRQSEQEETRWHRDREARKADWLAQQEWQRANPDPSPMVRDAQAWQTMTPEQRQSYQQMKEAGAGDPDVFVTLPNGQVYAGPKSGLTAALTGAPAAPPKPVGKLTPLGGGPAVAPLGGFPRPF